MKNNELKTKMIRHGEAILLPIDKLPGDAIEDKTVSSFTVAHSETGHNHVAVGEITTFTGFDASKLRTQLSKQLYGHAEITGLFRVNKPSRLEHKKSFDKHETKELKEGLYLVILKNEYNYFAKTLERVRD